MTEHVPQSGIPDKAALLALRETLRGKMLQPGDRQYDAARGIWNGMIDRRPDLIVRCHGVADVIAAVNFARDHGLLVAVRGGGHGVAGHAVCDGGMISICHACVRFGSIQARAEPGCRVAPHGVTSTARRPRSVSLLPVD